MSESATPRPRNSTNRRTVLGAGLAAGTTGALAVNAATAATSRAATSGQLSRSDAAFLNRGLQHGAWVAPPERYYPSGEVYSAQGGFTMPTFYDPDLYNKPLMEQLPGETWAITKAPYSDQIDGPPEPGRPFLNAEQQANAQNLFSICLGDEEGYGTSRVDWFRQYADQARAVAPQALVHTNQYSGQWSDAQIRDYIRRVQPDLLTWDNYYFHTAGSGRFESGSVTPMYNDTWRYRRLSLEGLDGAGTSPLAFGQYTLGYRNGNSQEGVGTRVVSESEQFVVSFVTWALGGKWLNLFRWEWSAGSQTWLLNDENGNLTVQYDRYAKLNSMMRNLSPYLVRLRTKNAGIVRGKLTNGDPTPASSIPEFTAATDKGIGLESVTVTKAPDKNGGQPTDTLIGTFRPIPELSAAQRGTYIPAATSPFFMVVNAAGFANDNPGLRDGTGGESATLRQTVRLTFNLKGLPYNPAGLRVVRATTGTVETVTLNAGSNGRYWVDWSIDGGIGDLFFWV